MPCQVLYRLMRLFQYPVPNRAAGVGPDGMSANPLVLFQAYRKDSQHFDVHETSSAVLTGMAQSRFIGRVCGAVLSVDPFR